MFLSRNKKINIYPCKPQFYCIKVGFKEVKVILYAFFCDARHETLFISEKKKKKKEMKSCLFLCATK